MNHYYITARKYTGGIWLARLRIEGHRDPAAVGGGMSVREAIADMAGDMAADDPVRAVMEAEALEVEIESGRETWRAGEWPTDERMGSIGG